MKASPFSDRKLLLSPCADNVAGGSHCLFANLGKGSHKASCLWEAVLGTMPHAADLWVQCPGVQSAGVGWSCPGSGASISSSVQTVRSLPSCCGYIWEWTTVPVPVVPVDKAEPTSSPWLVHSPRLPTKQSILCFTRENRLALAPYKGHVVQLCRKTP